MNKRRIKGVIFDLDGTLVDSMGVWVDVDKQYLTKRGFAVPDDLFADIEGGNSFIEVARYFQQKFFLTETVEEIIEEWKGMVSEQYDRTVRLKPGAREFLELLSASGVKIGLGTSNTEDLARRVLKANRVDHFFESIVTGCREIKGKPFPDIFLAVAGILSLEPEECLVCEDVLVGVEAAKRAGMRVVAIQDVYSEPERSKIEALADFFGRDFYDIIKFCNRECLI